MTSMALFARAILPVLALVRALFRVRPQQAPLLHVDDGRPRISMIRGIYL
ncbi:MAG: hypothetical protein ACYCW6_22015 [Candidatus Xenobia bacterium]